MSEWQPMSSAPRDGSVILLAQGDEVFAGFYKPDDKTFPWVFLDRGALHDGYINGFLDDYGKFGPYAWRPLPKYEVSRG